MSHQTKAGRSALEGKKTLAYMLRPFRKGSDVYNIAERYGRTPAEIANYLRQRGYSTTGNPLPPATVHTQPLVASAGGTAGYISASDRDAPVLPLKPVAYREKPEQRTVIDWRPVARPGPPPKLSPAEDKIVRERYEKGETARALARVFGVSDMTIARAIERAGGKTVGRSGRWRWRHELERKAELARQDQQEEAS